MYLNTTNINYFKYVPHCIKVLNLELKSFKHAVLILYENIYIFLANKNVRYREPIKNTV